MTLALCIPAYNAALYLPRLLHSAHNQTIPFDEILIYNDCSTDDTVKVAESLGAKVITGDVNRGCSYGKNHLASITTCDWIHFHDADDELLSNFTTLAHKWMSHVSDPDVVLFDYEYRENDGNELISVTHFDDLALQKDPIRYSILHQINPFCGLYKTKRLLEVGVYDLNPEILYNEDVAFHCKLAIAGFAFRSENEISIVNYRIGNSMSASNQLKCSQAHYQVMKLNAERVGNTYPKEIAQKLWYSAVGLAALNDWITCKKASSLAQGLNRKAPKNENLIVRLASYFDFYLTIKFREIIIRTIKPKLRNYL